MKPFQTKAVPLGLVAVALVLGYATLASAASTPHCRVSETSANGTVHLQWTAIATTSATETEPNGNFALASPTPMRAAEGLNAGVQVLPTGTDLASADPDDGGLIDGDDDGTDPTDDDADGDGSDGGDFDF